MCIKGQTESYEVLKDIKFTSDRKRMSVIVKDLSSGKVHCFTKGADIAIIKILSEERQEDSQVIDKMNSYASLGFRTLMFAMKELPSHETFETLKEEEASNLECNL